MGPVDMALLLEGQKFGLSSKSDNSKSVVLVKLTDSALRSLEEYLKHRAVFDKNGAAGPTIQFSQAGGAISLPSTSNDRGTVSYPFGLSASEDGGPNKPSSQGCLDRSTTPWNRLGPWEKLCESRLPRTPPSRVSNSDFRMSKWRTKRTRLSYWTTKTKTRRKVQL